MDIDPKFRGAFENFTRSLTREQLKIYKELQPYFKDYGPIGSIEKFQEVAPELLEPSFLPMYKNILQKALDNFEKIIADNDCPLKITIDFACGLSALGDLYRLDESEGGLRFSKSIKFLERALKIREEINDFAGCANTRVKLSLSLLCLEDMYPRQTNTFQRREELLLTAIEESKKTNFFPNLVNAVKILATSRILESQNNEKFNFSLFQRVLELIQELEKQNLILDLKETIEISIARFDILEVLKEEIPEDFIKKLEQYELLSRTTNLQNRETDKEELRKRIKYYRWNRIKIPEKALEEFEKEINGWDVSRYFERLREFIVGIFILEHRFPTQISPKEVIRLANNILQKYCSSLRLEINRDFFTKKTWLKDGALHRVAYWALHKNLKKEIVLILENYFCLEFKHNYQNLTFVADTPKKRFVHAKINILGNYANILRRVVGEDWKAQVLSYYETFNLRISQMVEPQEVEKLKAFDGKIRQQIKNWMDVGHPKQTIIEEIQKMVSKEVLLNAPDLFKDIPSNISSSNQLEVKDLEYIAKKNPDRVFIYLTLLQHEERLTGFGFGFNSKKNVAQFETYQSTHPITENFCQSVLRPNIANKESSPKAPDPEMAVFAKSIQEITQPWIEQGFQYITFIPINNGTKLIPWANIPNEEEPEGNKRLIDRVKGVSYCQTLLCYFRPIKKRKEKNKILFSGRSEKKPHHWGNFSMESCSQKNLAHKYISNVTRENLLQEITNATTLGFYCHGVQQDGQIMTGEMIHSYLVFDDREPLKESSSQFSNESFRHIWAPNTDGLPLNGIHSVELWACGSAMPVKQGEFEIETNETLSIKDHFMSRGVYCVLAPINCVFDFTTAIIASYYYHSLKSIPDEEEAFNATMGWYFNEAIQKLISLYDQYSKTDCLSRNQLYYKICSKFLHSEIGLQMPDFRPVFHTLLCNYVLGLDQDDEDDEDEDARISREGFYLMLNDPRTWNFVLWKGGKAHE